MPPLRSSRSIRQRAGPRLDGRLPRRRRAAGCFFPGTRNHDVYLSQNFLGLGVNACLQPSVLAGEPAGEVPTRHPDNAVDGVLTAAMDRKVVHAGCRADSSATVSEVVAGMPFTKPVNGDLGDRMRPRVPTKADLFRIENAILVD